MANQLYQLQVRAKKKDKSSIIRTFEIERESFRGAEGTVLAIFEKDVVLTI